MNSVWTDGLKRVKFGQLKEDIKTDVVVIGGGISGILCAHKLKNSGVDCVLVEAKSICEGVTGNTTAKITFQHGAIYHKLIKSFGEDKAKMYLEAQRKAFGEFAQLCQSIDCDYEKKDSYVYTIKDRAKIERETDALNRLGEKASFYESIDIPIDVQGAVMVRDQAQFNALKFVYKIVEDLAIYENTKVTELAKGRVFTDHGRIDCKAVVVATHFPILNKHGAYFLKIYQHRSYVLALDGAQNVDGMYVDEDMKGMSFRNYGRHLLLGGGSHRTGKHGGSFRELEVFTANHYPSATTVSSWATQDCMTLDSVPYIGRYSNKTQDLYVATGFNKWGMTSSMVAASVITDLVQGKQNEYETLFSPSRSMLHKQLAVNATESIAGLLTPTAPRCPHLGCALKYNREEHSWDCPCHGSRFSEKGELLDNPATDDKKM